MAEPNREVRRAARHVPGRRRRHRHTVAAALLTLVTAGCASEHALQWPEWSEPILPAAASVAPGAAQNAGHQDVPRTGSPRPRPGAESPKTAHRTIAPSRSGTADPDVQRTTSVDPSIRLIEAPPVVPPAPAEFPIDLSSALRLAEVENPDIAGARQAIFEAMGVLQGAYALMIPTLNAGTNYHGHTGNLQRSSGRILNLSEQSLYFGGGARTLAAESLSVPAVNITSALTDAIYAPLVESQRLDGVTFAAAGTTNQILLEVATLYFDLLGAEASLSLRRETEAEGGELARLTKVYADVGQGRQADANRAATEFAMLRREVQRAEEDVAVASTRLARRLHLDPVVRIRPVSPQVEPIPLVNLLSTTEALVEAAIRRRPEVGSTAAFVGAAEADLARERMRPFLPTVWLGFSGGAFGGGSNLDPPNMAHFAGRTDFDVRVFWTLQNFGIGNLALIRNSQGVVGEAMAAQSLAITRIRREVAEAQAVARAQQVRIETTRNQLERARQGFREELDRIRGTVSRSVEAVTSLELLDRARQDDLRAVIEYNQAQFQLFVALGAPPPLAEGAEGLPLPPAPVAFPPTPFPSREPSDLGWDGNETPAETAGIAIPPRPPVRIMP